MGDRRQQKVATGYMVFTYIAAAASNFVYVIYYLCIIFVLIGTRVLPYIVYLYDIYIIICTVISLKYRSGSFTPLFCFRRA